MQSNCITGNENAFGVGENNLLVDEDNKPSKMTRSSRLSLEQIVSHENTVVGSIARSTQFQSKGS